MPRELVIVTGMPGAGKTVFTLQLAKYMQNNGLHVTAFDQDTMEDNRMIARELIRAVTSCKTVLQTFKHSCQEIFSTISPYAARIFSQMCQKDQNEVSSNQDSQKDNRFVAHKLIRSITSIKFASQGLMTTCKKIFKISRPKLLQSLCTTSAYFLNQHNLVLAANLREEDMTEHGFKQLLGKFLSEYCEEPVSVIGVHLQSDEQQGLQRIEHRNVPNDAYEVIHDRAAYGSQCEKYAGNGPLFNKEPEKSLQSMTLYPFGKTPDALIKEFYQALEATTPYQISPLIGPRLPCTDNSCYPRLFPKLMK